MNYGAGNSFAQGAATGFEIMGGMLDLLEKGKKAREASAIAGSAMTGGGGTRNKVHVRPMIPIDKGNAAAVSPQGDAIKLEIPPEQGGSTYVKVKGIKNDSITTGQARAKKANDYTVRQNNAAKISAQKADLIRKGIVLDNKLKQAKVDGIPNLKLQNEYDTTKKRYEMLLAKKKVTATGFDIEVKKEKKKQEKLKTKTVANKVTESANQVTTSKFKAKKSEQDYLKSLKKTEVEGKLKFNDGTPTTVDQLIKMYNAGDRETSLQEFINKTTGHNLFTNPRQKTAGGGKFTTFITPDQRALASKFLKQGSLRKGSRGDVLNFVPKP